MAEYNFAGDDFLEVATPPADGGGGGGGVAESTAEVQAPAPETATVDTAPAAGAEAATPAAPASTISPEVSQLLSRERLATIPGESNDAALRRLYDHQRQRADRLYYEEVKGAKTAAQAARDELSAFKQAMDPLIRAFNERTQQVEQELRQSKIPEQGTPEYLVWQQQQIMAKLEEAEQRAAEERRLASETAEQESLLIEDEAADYELEVALAQDQDARAAYEFATQLGMRAAARAYPNATIDQIQEVVRLSQVLDMRAARRNGVSVGDLYKQRRADVMQLMGVVQQPAVASPAPAAATTPTTTAANGKATNGAAKPGSTTARQLSTAKAQAAARAVVSPTPQAAAAPTGDSIDFSQMDEESLLEFTLASPENAAEYSRWINDKFGKASWR